MKINKTPRSWESLPRSIFNVSKTGELSVCEHEGGQPGIDMVGEIRLRQPIDPQRLAAAYERLVLTHETLRCQWAPDPDGRDFSFYPYPMAQVHEFIRLQREHLARYHTAEDVICTDKATCHMPLPIRLSLLDEQTLVFNVNHIFMNAYAAATWIELLLAYYGLEQGLVTFADVRALEKKLAKKAPQLLWLTNSVQMPFKLLQTWAWLKLFMWRAGAQDYDPPAYYKKTPSLQTGRYTYQKYILSEERSAALLADARSQGLTFTQYMLVIIAEEFFRHAPEKNRMFFYLPTVAFHKVPGVSMLSPGNYVGSAWVQFLRGKPLKNQVIRQYDWLRKDIPYWLYVMMNLKSGPMQPERQKILEARNKCVFDNGNMGNASLVFSSMATASWCKYLHHFVDFWGLISKPKNLPIFTCSSIHGRMCFGFASPDDFCNSTVLLGIIEGIIARLANLADALSA